MKDKDLLTSIIGYAGAVATSATPILNGVQSGSLHQADWIGLVTAVLFGLLGHFTNKK